MTVKRYLPDTLGRAVEVDIHWEPVVLRHRPQAGCSGPLSGWDLCVMGRLTEAEPWGLHTVRTFTVRDHAQAVLDLLKAGKITWKTALHCTIDVEKNRIIAPGGEDLV